MTKTKNTRTFISVFILFLGFVMFCAGIFFNSRKVYYRPVTAEIQEALKKGEKVPRQRIYELNEPWLIEGFSFDKFKLGPNGDIEKVPSLGFCES